METLNKPKAAIASGLQPRAQRGGKQSGRKVVIANTMKQSSGLRCLGADPAGSPRPATLCSRLKATPRDDILIQRFLIAIYIFTSFMFTASAEASGLGRLFFTPEQRAQLEQIRTRHATANATGNATADATAEDELSSSSVLTVNGIVQKKGGARTVWINGVSQNAGSSDERSPESVPVPVPGQAQPVKIKVGQKLLLDTPPQHKPAEKKPPQPNLPASDD